MEKTGRGVTYWMGKGAYTENDQYIFFIVQSINMK